MKILLQILLLNLAGITLYSQNIISIGSFPAFDNENKPIKTADLLTRLNWSSIKFQAGNGHYAHEYVDSLITTYDYTKQGRASFFEIKSFNGLVLEFKSEVSGSNQNSNSYYFDKSVWLQYVNKVLPELSEEFKLDKEESDEMSKAYYRLLGAETRDEYGWYCEYSAMGRPTQRRLEVIKLIAKQRRDLLKKLLAWPNVQTQLYAADALIYLDLETKNRITELNKKITDQEKRLDSLRLLSADEKENIQYLKENIKLNSNYIKTLNDQLLSKADWKNIYYLRDSNKDVKICKDGTGSYRIYPGKTSDLLSEKAIADIPRQYERLAPFLFR